MVEQNNELAQGDAGETAKELLSEGEGEGTKRRMTIALRRNYHLRIERKKGGNFKSEKFKNWILI